MNSFWCPHCRLPLSETEPDRKDKWFVRVECSNPQCDFDFFSGCTICDSNNNTGSTANFYKNHRKSPVHNSNLDKILINKGTTEVCNKGNDTDISNNQSDANTYRKRSSSETNTICGTWNSPSKNNCSNFKAHVDDLVNKKESLLRTYLDYLKKTSD